MKDNKNRSKVIGTTAVAALCTIIVELAMYAQLGTNLLSGVVLGRVATMLILALVIIGLAIADWRFDGYLTILAMILWALANFGGFSQVSDRTSLVGILTQLVAIVGFLASLAGIWYGIMQRKFYSDRKLRGRLK